MKEVIKNKIKGKIESKISLFRVFDYPRPKYIAKVTLIDRILDKVFLWAFPQSVRPNFLTIFRFVTIPFILAFLYLEFYKLSFFIFVLSAFSDALDGAIARTRDQITSWGIVFDPFADKLLIGSVGGMLIFKFLNHNLAFTILFLELVLIISAYYRFKGKIVPAKTVGKLKMVFQCFGVGFIFLFILTGNYIFLNIATYILYLAVLFATLSLIIYKSI